jgi:signal peptidase
MVRKVVGAFVTAAVASALAVGVIGMLSGTGLVGAIPALRGTRPWVVLSGSMEPEVPVGSLVFVRPGDVASVGVGDIITFDVPRSANGRGGVPTTHRVVGVDRDGSGLAFQTKGDANATEDPWTVPADSVRGRALFAVPYLGFVSVFVRSPFGFVLLVVVPALLLVAGEIREITGFDGRPCAEDSGTRAAQHTERSA